MQKKLAIFIIIICTVLLQAHSIPFWHDKFTSGYSSFWSVNILALISYLTSFSIEFVAIYGWLTKQKILSYGTSAVVILVPLLHISSPLIDELKSNETKTQLIYLNNKRIEQNLKLQDKFINTNWAGTIIKTDNNFNSLANKQEKLLNHNNFNTLVMILIEGWSLIMFFYAQVIYSRALAFRDFEKLETHNFSNSETAESSETRAETLLKDIEQYLKDNDMLQSSLAFKLVVSPSSISKLRAKVTGIGEAISNNKLDELETKFKELKNG